MYKSMYCCLRACIWYDLSQLCVCSQAEGFLSVSSGTACAAFCRCTMECTALEFAAAWCEERKNNMEGCFGSFRFVKLTN